jgi:macrodomain Ter protein organizer (MatP/YcbG family)
MYKSLAFLEATGTVAEREATANVDERVKDAVEAHRDAVVEKMTIMTRRKAMELKIEVWRTQQSTNRTKML